MVQHLQHAWNRALRERMDPRLTVEKEERRFSLVRSYDTTCHGGGADRSPVDAEALRCIETTAVPGTARRQSVPRCRGSACGRTDTIGSQSSARRGGAAQGGGIRTVPHPVPPGATGASSDSRGSQPPPSGAWEQDGARQRARKSTISTCDARRSSCCSRPGDASSCRSGDSSRTQPTTMPPCPS